MTYWQEWTQAQFAAAPTVENAWNTGDLWWDSLVLLPTRRRHDSGYALFTVLGITKDSQDAKVWRLHDYDVVNFWQLNEFINMDCLYPSRLFRVFAMEHEISYSYGRVRLRKRVA